MSQSGQSDQETLLPATRIAVVMASYNRQELTLRCIKSIEEQSIGPPDIQIDLFLFDDFSSDGTRDAVCGLGRDNITLLIGDGNAFWTGGMHAAFSAAKAGNYDYYIWLNDDTLLLPDAFARILQTHRELFEEFGDDCIVVGSTRTADLGQVTYGGLKSASAWRPLNYQLVYSDEKPVECEIMNGNCVLISRSAANRVGNVNLRFRHLCADYEYALRARKRGVPVWVAPGYIGICEGNSSQGTWRDRTLHVRDRIRNVMSIKGLPPQEWFRFARATGKRWWWLAAIVPYFKMLLNRTKV